MTPEEELIWSGRPMRHMTMSELEQALEVARAALVAVTSRFASEACQLGIEKLEIEIAGRRLRA